MLQITSVAQIQAFDRALDRQGQTVLYVERAAHALLDACRPDAPVAIVCGGGNNGADGYALGCLLAARGISCHIFRCSAHFSAVGHIFYEQACNAGIPNTLCTEQTDLSPYAQIVDCIFGTGFAGDPRGVAASMIRRINQAAERGAYVLSADVPSGLNAENGIANLCVCADRTVALGGYKPGHFLKQAHAVCGRLTCDTLGICLPHVALLPQREDYLSWLPDRAADTHKGSYGTVCILGGSRRYTGAPKLANLAQSALRSGCGISRLCVPNSLTDAVAPLLLESTLYPMPERDGQMCFDEQALMGALQGAVACAVGMGWGSSPEYEKILDFLLQQPSLHLIIDADGLNTLARMDLSVLSRAAAQVVLTPHPMEFQRLSGVAVDDILQAPLTQAAAFAAQHGCTVLLKGSTTTVTDGHTTYLVNRGTSGMATAGSGDVLSGALCGLCGFMPANVQTAALGAYLCGTAGELAAAHLSEYAMLASDTATFLPKAFEQLLQVQHNKRRMLQ